MLGILQRKKPSKNLGEKNIMGKLPYWRYRRFWIRIKEWWIEKNLLEQRTKVV